MSKLIDWTGQIFNGCEILEPVDKMKIKCKDKWKVKCHCGKIFETATPKSLKTSNTTSCGCEKQRTTLLRMLKHNYYNYINPDSKVQLIEPLDPLKSRSIDDWIALCPRHDPPKQFITKPHDIIANLVKSCGCLNTEKRIEQANNIHKKRRLSAGLKENEYLTKEILLVRFNIVDHIKHLILKLDGYTCNLCLDSTGGNLEVHHIIPINQFLNYSDQDTYKNLYDLNNLITLCISCHHYVHDNYHDNINLNIQQELQAITSMRPIPKDILNQYNEIVKTKIEPWIENYLEVKKI